MSSATPDTSGCANGAQSLFDTNVSGYLIEAPSTMNELLLAQDLLRKNTDKRFRRWVLSSLIGHTYYHNFVTHLREAWYQREAMNIIEQGGAVNAETLSGIFRKNLETFWGDAVELTEGCELTWMRRRTITWGSIPTPTAPVSRSQRRPRSTLPRG